MKKEQNDELLSLLRDDCDMIW